jgi:hypothetical protein
MSSFCTKAQESTTVRWQPRPRSLTFDQPILRNVAPRRYRASWSAGAATPARMVYVR